MPRIIAALAFALVAFSATAGRRWKNVSRLVLPAMANSGQSETENTPSFGAQQAPYR